MTIELTTTSLKETPEVLSQREKLSDRLDLPDRPSVDIYSILNDSRARGILSGNTDEYIQVKDPLARKLYEAVHRSSSHNYQGVLELNQDGEVVFNGDLASFGELQELMDVDGISADENALKVDRSKIEKVETAKKVRRGLGNASVILAELGAPVTAVAAITGSPIAIGAAAGLMLSATPVSPVGVIGWAVAGKQFSGQASLLLNHHNMKKSIKYYDALWSEVSKPESGAIAMPEFVPKFVESDGKLHLEGSVNNPVAIELRRALGKDTDAASYWALNRDSIQRLADLSRELKNRVDAIKQDAAAEKQMGIDSAGDVVLDTEIMNLRADMDAELAGLRDATRERQADQGGDRRFQDTLNVLSTMPDKPSNYEGFFNTMKDALASAFDGYDFRGANDADHQKLLEDIRSYMRKAYKHLTSSRQFEIVYEGLRAKTQVSGIGNKMPEWSEFAKALPASVYVELNQDPKATG